MHWKIQIVNISITRDMVSHIRGRHDCINKFTRHVSTSDLPIPEAGDITARKRF